jgi:protein-disulfide isomerase
MTTTPFRVTSPRLTVPVNESDHVRGPENAPVTMVEYGDFQCPYCGAAYPVVEELLAQRPETVRFAYRHFPLTNIHEHAEIAAETSEAAGARGSFWPMHHWLFEHQAELDPSSLLLGTAQVGLPSDAVELEVTRHVYLDKIQRDFASGVRSGVNGTPTFFVNGLRHDGEHSLAALLKAVDSAVDS